MPKQDDDLSREEKRQIFALAALNGLMSNPGERNDSPLWAEAYAKVSIEAADALIARLDAPPPPNDMDRVRRFKEEFFKRVQAVEFRMTSDEVIGIWRAAWEQAA